MIFVLIQDAVSSVRNSSEKNVKVVVIVQDSGGEMNEHKTFRA